MSPVSLVVHNSSKLVPQLYYNDTNFGQFHNPGLAPQTGIVTEFRIYALAYRAAASGQPVPLSPLYPNVTYRLAFYGPAVKCAASTDRASIRNISIAADHDLNIESGCNFVSIVGRSSGLTSSKTLEDLDKSTLDMGSGNASFVTVMTRQGNWSRKFDVDTSLDSDYAIDPFQEVPIDSSSEPSHTIEVRSEPKYATEANVTECQLYNASYTVDFSFRYPEQSHAIQVTEWLNTVSYDMVSREVQTEEATSYLAVMDAFGKMLVGSSCYKGHHGITVETSTSWSMLKIDWEDGAAVRNGLEQLFQNITLSLLSESVLM